MPVRPEEAMMQEPGASSDYPCRDVTAAEVAHYQEHGWAKLDGLVHPDLVARLLAIARRRMGEDGDSNAPIALKQPFFNPEFGGGLADRDIRPLIGRVGRSAKALMARRAPVEVRYFTDFFAAKLPASRQSTHAGNGRTDFHQDFITWALDRSGGMTFWIALTDLKPESGTMSFASGSHRMGMLGGYHSYGGGDLLDSYPEVRERCPISAAITYAAGDATVHSNLCVHGSGENLTDKPRWAYLIIVNPADACWTGAPPEAYDTSGLRIHQTLDDERFPILSQDGYP